VGAIEVDTLYEDAMEMEVHIERAAKTLEKRDRARVDGGSRVTALDRLVDVILPDGHADDGMDLGRELRGCRHPVAQVVGHRDAPSTCRAPGHDLPAEVRPRLRHAPPGTRRTNPPPLATEGHQERLLTGVTAETEKPVCQDATPQIVVKFPFHIRGEAGRLGVV